MSKYKYKYHPNDDESDYNLGATYRGKVRRTILTQSKHPRAIEVEFSDGRVTTVHKKSFDMSGTAIDFYPKGVAITLKKVGYMANQRITKWVIMRPLKYDLYGSDGISQLIESKRVKSGVTHKYESLPPSSQKDKISIISRIKGAICSIMTRSS